MESSKVAIWVFYQWLSASLTDNCQHARGFGGLCIAFILSFIIKDCLVDDEDMLATCCNYFILFPFSDFTAILKPANLFQNKRPDKNSTNVRTVNWCCITSVYSKSCAHINLPWHFHVKLHIQISQIPSLWPQHHGVAYWTQHLELWDRKSVV